MSSDSNLLLSFFRHDLPTPAFFTTYTTELLDHRVEILEIYDLCNISFRPDYHYAIGQVVCVSSEGLA